MLSDLEGKKADREANVGALIGLGKGYEELEKKLSYYQDKLSEQRIFILGISLGILGNLGASYIIELHLLIAGLTFWTILAGLFFSVTALIIWQYNYHKKKLIPLEKRIAEMESFKKEVRDIILKIGKEMGESVE